MFSMSDTQKKRFLTYDEQIDLLKSKNLLIEDTEKAKEILKEYSYYSLVSGYKDMFKIEKNGNYRDKIPFEYLVNLYVFDDHLRNIFLHEIIRIEKHIKSLYSYSFCEVFGDAQSEYLNATNYDYSKYQKEINDFLSIVQNTLDKPDRYRYIKYNIDTYGTVPLWVIIQTFTFGNLSKMYMFSKPTLQSKIAREFDEVYPNQLSSMLNVLSKFRNVCAHGERFYNYKTKKSIVDLPIHNKLKDYNTSNKNDLFNVLICFKYLSKKEDFNVFVITLDKTIGYIKQALGEEYYSTVLEKMGFPENWKDIIELDKK
ncbi:MAG: Abi family protein [Ruminococcus sp.]|nr:Abi family protein [Ruminococcus sp.]